MIEVIRAGPLTSIQDLGRRGYRHVGIGSAGALDPLALRIANCLVHNSTEAAGIEVTAGPTQFCFCQEACFALAGADYAATLGEKPLRPWWRYQARRGQILTFKMPHQGMRAYLAIFGGIDVPIVLGSRSTHLSAGTGGFSGRALRSGDLLSIGATTNLFHLFAETSIGIRPPEFYQREQPQAPPTSLPPIEIRALSAPEYDFFSLRAQTLFWQSHWVLTPQSNRMGFRLAGPVISCVKKIELLSHGIIPGIIQVPPSGQPIVLMADAQTTGGYPRIGVVITADLPKLAQVPLGGLLQFVSVSYHEAKAALSAQRKYISSLEISLLTRWNPALNGAI
jgi:5-oxoprolinase (ATP-hydrolysing) subunit C